MPRFAAKVDVNHAAIRDTLRQMGFTVLDTARQGGFCDLVAMRHGRITLIEVKTHQSKRGTVRLTESQQALIRDGWPLQVLSTVDEAITWAQSER